MTNQPTKKKRINILSVPLDILPNGSFETRIGELLAEDKPQQIVLLDLWNFVRARRNRSYYAKCVDAAALVLPSSRTLQRISRFLRKRHVPRYLPFDFVIRLLGMLEKKGKSVYMIGSKPSTLQTASSNVRGSFPGLDIVGRCAGFYDAKDEEDIILAIRKASPTLILAGNGLTGHDKWLFEHRADFAPGIVLWAGSCIEMFSGKKKRTSRELWTKGLDFVPELIRRPWRMYRGFVYLRTVIVVLYRKIKKL